MAITEVTTETNAETEPPPAVDERDPATLIPAAVDEILELAQTWLAWDGAPILGDGNAWTPHKALRRVTDHLLDHLAEIEATLAGEPTVPDTWLGRTITLDSDWARFTEGDLNEAANRLRRYAELYRVRLAGLTGAELDEPRPSAWTVRQIAHHVAGVTYYARQVGDLTDRHPDAGRGPGRPAQRVVLLPARTGAGRRRWIAGYIRVHSDPSSPWAGGYRRGPGLGKDDGWFCTRGGTKLSAVLGRREFDG